MQELATTYLHTHRQQCWDCANGDHIGGRHPWADQDDVDHALSHGMEDPSPTICACDCTKRERVLELLTERRQ